MSLDLRKAVTLKSRADLQLFVRALSANQELDLRDSLTKVEGAQAILAAQLAAYVCDADGNPKFATLADATAFMDTVRGNVVAKLVKEAQRFNDLTDEALEDAEKNDSPAAAPGDRDSGDKAE